MFKNSREDLISRRDKFGSLGSLDFLISYIEGRGYANVCNCKNSLHDVDFTSYDKRVVSSVPRFSDKTSRGERTKNDLFLKAKAYIERGGNIGGKDIIEIFYNDLEKFPEAHLLLANNYLKSSNEEAWLTSLNQYLLGQDVSPVFLEQRSDKELFYRLNSKPRRSIFKGPKVSVLITSFNAEKTIYHSVLSILNQSWKNLEVIVIDDCSTDSTSSILKDMVVKDDRLIVKKSTTNSGPYVAKNLALELVTGDFITGHDADDWSHPERIEKQVAYIKEYSSPVSLSYMLRVKENGFFSYLGKRTGFSPDGALRKALISTMVCTRFFRKYIGSWDCVRFGADSELFDRLKIAMRDQKIPEAPFVSMLCLDLEKNLTNHPSYGIDKITGETRPRVAYKNAWRKWHKTLSADNVLLTYGEGRNNFPVPSAAFVNPFDTKLESLP